MTFHYYVRRREEVMIMNLSFFNKCTGQYDRESHDWKQFKLNKINLIQTKHIFLSHNAINFGAKWVFIFSHFNILHFVTKYFTGGDLQQKSEISNGRMATSPD